MGRKTSIHRNRWAERQVFKGTDGKNKETSRQENCGKKVL